MAFIGAAVTMSISYKGDMREYWSTLAPLEAAWFPSIVSCHRFRMIQTQRYLHLSDSTRAPMTADGKLCDKLYKVRPLLDALITSFPQHFIRARHEGQAHKARSEIVGPV